jgi:2-polyprenyl-6-methoxyphenol hydroxylase-like FAD-dependent oxidoreductase
MVPTDVLIAGAGPVGLTAAIELVRRGVDLRIVNPVVAPPQYAKAVDVQPRTLEVFRRDGCARLPADVPCGFTAIPQYVRRAT